MSYRYRFSYNTYVYLGFEHKHHSENKNQINIVLYISYGYLCTDLFIEEWQFYIIPLETQQFLNICFMSYL